jgi:hypothetical protein
VSSGELVFRRVVDTAGTFRFGGPSETLSVFSNLSNLEKDFSKYKVVGISDAASTYGLGRGAPYRKFAASIAGMSTFTWNNPNKSVKIGDRVGWEFPSKETKGFDTRGTPIGKMVAQLVVLDEDTTLSCMLPKLVTASPDSSVSPEILESVIRIGKRISDSGPALVLSRGPRRPRNTLEVTAFANMDPDLLASFARFTYGDNRATANDMVDRIVTRRPTAEDHAILLAFQFGLRLADMFREERQDRQIGRACSSASAGALVDILLQS